MIKAEVIADSITETGHRLTTVQYRAPRCILSELNTHRAFARNARSSRAVPTSKLLEEVRNDPFIPQHWGKNQPGMQARSELYGQAAEDCREIWLEARNKALHQVEGLLEYGVHKQVVNRLLEPWMWVDGLISSTCWKNFFVLRCHDDAEPHMRKLAEAIRYAVGESWPALRDEAEYHLPYITAEERLHGDIHTVKYASAARCARVSYRPFDGTSGCLDTDAEKGRAMAEHRPVHASPFEMVASADPFWMEPAAHRNYRGWIQFRAELPDDTVRG
ncbi:MAG: FAD-dependent thymidylate synthase [Rhodospirillaceae bacterium]